VDAAKVRAAPTYGVAVASCIKDGALHLVGDAANTGDESLKVLRVGGEEEIFDVLQ